MPDPPPFVTYLTMHAMKRIVNPIAAHVQIVSMMLAVFIPTILMIIPITAMTITLAHTGIIGKYSLM